MTCSGCAMERFTMKISPKILFRTGDHRLTNRPDPIQTFPRGQDHQYPNHKLQISITVISFYPEVYENSAHRPSCSPGTLLVPPKAREKWFGRQQEENDPTGPPLRSARTG